MTSLTVRWLRATRPRDEVVAFESFVRDRLVALAGGVENARRYHDDHYRGHPQPGSHWDRITKQAEQDAAADFPPTERSRVRVQYLFLEK